MPVGNDVVDLEHPLCQPDAIHPRFDTRAFSASEIAQLAASDRVHRTRWSLWAAKESAFKAARKLDPQVRFIPRDFAVRLSGNRAAVTHRLGHFDIWFDQADEWVHAVASRGGEKPGFQIDGPPSTGAGVEEEDSGERVRKLARTALGDFLNIAPSEIQIVSVDRIPRAQRQGAPLPVDLSLSHDGRFVACAAASLNRIDQKKRPAGGGKIRQGAMTQEFSEIPVKILSCFLHRRNNILHGFLAVREEHQSVVEGKQRVRNPGETRA